MNNQYDENTIIQFIKKNREMTALLLLFTIIVAINTPRLFSNLFWGDECYTIISTWSYDNFINMGLGDRAANPPLYYTMIYCFSSLFGSSPFVYHLFSFIAEILILIVAITMIRKYFGFGTALIFMILCSFLDNSLGNMMEARSYEWCALFILMVFLFLYKILKEHKTTDYLLFTLFSLLAAYTHYYSLLVVSFFYLVLLIESFGSSSKKKWFLITLVLSVGAYLPWVLYVYNASIKAANGFWIADVPLISDCILYTMSSDFSIVLSGVLIVSTAFAIYYSFKGKEQRKTEGTWLVAGSLSYLGTMVVAILFSLLIRPLLIVRYVYPLSVIGWLLLSYSIMNVWNDNYKKKAPTVFVALLVLFIAIPGFADTAITENSMEKETNETLSALSCISSDDYMVTDNIHFNWTVFDYYLPEPHHYDYTIDPCNLPLLDPSLQYYLIISEKMNGSIETELTKQGYSYETMVENGRIDIYPLNAYKLIKL